MNDETRLEITGDYELVPKAVKEAGLKAFHALGELHVTTLAEVGSQHERRSDSNVLIHWTPQMSKEEFFEKTFQTYGEAEADVCATECGRVYCYNCQSDACDHSTPNVESHVFAGYEDTGRPKWMEFFNYLLSLDDSRVDILFSNSPPVLAKVVGRRELIKDQLTSYGRSSMTYRIIGQVVSGYFSNGRKRFALTAQVIENRSRKLSLQVISCGSMHEMLASFPGKNGTSLDRLLDVMHETRHRIIRLNSRWQGTKEKSDRSKLLNKIFSVLRHLANSLERKGRQKNRRTSHAEKRLHDERPIHKAYDDLTSAGPERFFQDNRTGRIVVFGKNGRSHVFSKQGRHVTSLTLTSDKLELRRKRNRYQSLNCDQVRRFLTILKEVL